MGQGTSRRAAPAVPENLKGPRGPVGPTGQPGAQGERGHDSPLLEISESSSAQLMGAHAEGFALEHAEGAFIECSFQEWEPEDILHIHFVVSLAEAAMSGILTFQPQIMLRSGSMWHALRGAQALIGPYGFSAVGAGSIQLGLAPTIRIHVAPWGRRLDYGPGPEPSSILLRAERWRKGSYTAVGALQAARA